MRIIFIFRVLILCSTLMVGANANAQKERFCQLLDSFEEFEYSDGYSAKMYLDSAEGILGQVSDPLLIGDYYIRKGWYHQDVAQYDQSRDFFYKALAEYESIQSFQKMADAYGNLGNAYFDVEDFSQALKFHQKSLMLNENLVFESKDSLKKEQAERGRAYAFTNIASIYVVLKQYEKSLEFEMKSLEYELKKDDSLGMGISFLGIGNLYERMGDNDSAFYYLKFSKDIFEKEQYGYGLIRSLMGLSDLEKDSVIARNYLLQALDIAVENQDPHSEMNVLSRLFKADYGLPSATLDKFVRDINDLQQDSVLARTTFTVYHPLAEYHYKNGDYLKSSLAYKKYLFYLELDEKQNERDELKKEIMRNEFQMKSFSDSLQIQTEFANKSLQDERKINEQRNIIIIAVAGGILMLVLLFFLFKSIKTKNLNNRLLGAKNQRIQDQKELVDEKNKQITDSINYAKRLQGAILPPLSALHDNFKEAFVLFKPKDVVSGDFYWFESKKGLVFIAAADCTGHGVPGAMVSVVCANALNRVVNEFECVEANKILDKTRDIVVETFARSGEDVKDGMDISLCVIDRKNNKISFAGANNPLWICKPKTKLKENEIADVELDDFVLLDIKGDKQPIGLYTQSSDFKQFNYHFDESDNFYLFTDGYADQFGGEQGKKLKYKTLKNLILQNQNESLSKQDENLDQFIVNWMGDFEQLDDICVIGFKP